MEEDRKKAKELKETIQDMSVSEMIISMTKEDRSKLYEALLHIDEVGLLGNGLLRDLFRMVQKNYWNGLQQFPS